MRFDCHSVLAILPYLACTIRAERCPTGHIDTTAEHDGVAFSDLLAPQPEVYGCLNQQVQLVCCMVNFTSIDWYQQQEGRWDNFSSPVPAKWERKLTERNQVANINEALTDTDSGLYKCVGRGRVYSDVIQAVINLTLIDCAEYRFPPKILFPSPYEDNEISRNVDDGNKFCIRCQAFYGYLQQCGQNCTIGWYRQEKDGGKRERIGRYNHDSTRVYVEEEATKLNGAAMEIRLHFNRLIASDYNGFYVCVAESIKYPPEQTSRVKFVPPAGPVPNYIVTLVSIAITILVVGAVVLRKRLQIQLLVKELRRKPPADENLQYEVMMLAGPDDNIARTVLMYLTLPQGRYKPFSYKPFVVFQYPDDVIVGSLFTEFYNTVRQTRCLLVVLSPLFMKDELCVYVLTNCLPLVDVVYVTHDLDLDSPDRISDLLGEAVGANYCDSSRRVIWPSSDQTELDSNVDSVASSVWRDLRLAIPQRRRTPVPGEIGSTGAATSYGSCST